MSDSAAGARSAWKSVLADRRARLGLIVLLAFALRLAYIADVSESPFFHRPIIDQKSYHQWALEIAAGDWIGDEPFYQDPLYPYGLAALYAVFGANITLVYVLQAALSSLACLAVFGVGRRLFDGEAVGCLAALFWALYEVDFFYEAQLLKTGPGMALVMLCLWLLAAARDRRSAGLAFSAGLAAGLLPLYRGNFLLAAPVLAAWLVWSLWRNSGRAARLPAALCVIGLAVPPAVTMARNHAVSGEWVITTAQGGTNFYMGNFKGNEWGAGMGPDFVRRTPELEQEDFRSEAFHRTGRWMSDAELSRYWLSEAVDEIADAPGLTVLRTGRKLLLILNRHELSDNLSYDFYRKHYSVLLSLPFPAFWLAGPFGLAGMVLAARRQRGGLLFVYAGAYIATLLLLYVLGRYRMPLAPAFLVFAAYGLVEARRLWREHARRPLYVYLAVLAAAMALAWPRWLPVREDASWLKVGNARASAGQWEEAVRAYRASLEENPSLAEAWLGLGVAYESRLMEEEALLAYRRASELVPELAVTHLRFASLLERTGRREQAILAYERALRVDADLPAARRALDRLGVADE